MFWRSAAPKSKLLHFKTGQLQFHQLLNFLISWVSQILTLKSLYYEDVHANRLTQLRKSNTEIVSPYSVSNEESKGLKYTNKNAEIEAVDLITYLKGEALLNY